MSPVRMDGVGQMRAGIFALLSLLAWGSLPLRAQDPPFRAYTVAEGLPSNTVYTCTEDREGRLWFATDAGAARFDGQHFENFTTTDGLVDNEVLGIFNDSRERTWFLSLNGRLCFLEHGHFHDERDHPELAMIRPASGVLSVAESPTGTLWFAGQTGPLYAWDQGNAWSVSLSVGCPGSSVDRGIPRLVHLPGQEPWLMLNSSLFRIRQGAPRFVRCWSCEMDGYPIAAASGNDLIAVGRTGIVRASMVADQMLCPLAALPQPVVLRMPFVSKNGDIWLPTDRNGVVVLDSTGERMRWMLPGVNVNSVLQDSEGNMWLNTNGKGSIRIDPWQQRIRIFRNNSEDRNVTSVLVARSGAVFYGTDRGTINMVHDGRTTNVIDRGILEPNFERVRDLQEGSDGRIWFTTDKRAGFIALKGEQAAVNECAYWDERTPQRPPRASAGLKAVATGGDGQVVASFFGIADLVDTLGHPMFITRSRYWPAEHRMYAPFIDHDGNAWFETNEHPHRLRGGVREEFPDLEDRCGSRITDIDQLPDGTMVLGTAGNGVVLMRNDRFLRRFGRHEGIPSDQVRAAVVRGNEVLIATDEGACSIADPGGQARIRTWGECEGLSGLDIKDIDRDSTTIYMATPAGLLAFAINAPAMSRAAPRLARIWGVINDSILRAAPFIQVRSADRLVLRVEAIHFSMPERIHYEMSPDFGTTWSTTDREILMNMPAAGEHELYFRARVPGSSWSNTLKLHLSVVPPWHQQAWFRVIAFAVLAGAVVMFMRWRWRIQDQRHRAHTERRSAIQAERQRIASDMHDDIGADISHLLMMTRQYAESPSLVSTDRSNLSSIETAANGLLQKIDEVIWSIAPQDDNLHDALSFIQRHAETFAEAHGMAFRTQPLPPLPAVPLFSHHRRELYLMVKEVLHNIAKHTSARTLRFSVAMNAGTLLIRIEDDGNAIAVPGVPRNGHGRVNLRLRAERLGAVLRQEALDPVGSAITIELPLGTIHYK